MKAEVFLSLSAADRAEALRVAASTSGRPAHLLEKDVWVVWTLNALFNSSFAEHLVFKGGTSLSKVYKAISRFSEDIDITYDIRALAPHLVEGAGDNPVPPSKSQGKKWTNEITKELLPEWIRTTALPHIQSKIDEANLEAKLAAADSETILLEYKTELGAAGRYVSPIVRIEFGARSTGLPTEDREIVCDAAEYLPTLTFPKAQARVMHVDRTAWEKLTAIHIFCLEKEIKDRNARHWYDIVQLDAAGRIDTALNDRDVAQRVAEHKRAFFLAKDANGNPVDYFAAIGGGLVLVPQDGALDALATDYKKMIEDGLFLSEPPTFDVVVERCKSIQERANKIGSAQKNGAP